MSKCSQSQAKTILCTKKVGWNGAGCKVAIDKDSEEVTLTA